MGKSPRVCMRKWRGILRWVSLGWVSLRIIKMVGKSPVVNSPVGKSPSTFFLLLFMHFRPGTTTTHAE